jgi:hypothetical protein
MTVETTGAQSEPTVPISPPAKRIKTDSDARVPDDEAMETANGTANGTAKQQQELQPPPLLIKKLSDKARLPTRGSAFAAGYDLYASQDTTIPARGKALVDTDISMSVPAGTCKSRTFKSTFFARSNILAQWMLTIMTAQTVALRPGPGSLPSTSLTRAPVSSTPTTGARSRFCCSTTAKQTFR